ncbi:Fur family transcriptional regulator (plasmid) [Nitrobacteraceae bacterium UC4446_H13]
MSAEHALHPSRRSSTSLSPNAGVATAEQACRERGVQLTKIRRLVLETLWKAEHPLGAYEIMSVLEHAASRRLSPPTVYRALEFLVEQRFISRIETKNAYVPCSHPDHPHACVFFICDRCGSSAEVENPAIEYMFDRDAEVLGFRIGRRVVELQGTCATCQTGGDHSLQSVSA